MCFNSAGVRVTSVKGLVASKEILTITQGMFYYIGNRLHLYELSGNAGILIF